MSIRAILSTLPYKIKADNENALYRQYMAKGLQISTQNIAAILGIVSRGNAETPYMALSYDEIINPKPQKQYIKGEIAEKIKSKFR